jgi:hypothetical protein
MNVISREQEQVTLKQIGTSSRLGIRATSDTLKEIKLKRIPPEPKLEVLRITSLVR